MNRLRRIFSRAAGRILRVEVEGRSMVPTLAPGERLLVHRTRHVRVGDIVVFVDPEEATRRLIKRVTAVTGESVLVAGDNRDESRDSSEFGPVPRRLILGRAWYRYFPTENRKRLRRH